MSSSACIGGGGQKPTPLTERPHTADSPARERGRAGLGAVCERVGDQPMPSIVDVTLKLASSFTVTTEPSALVMCTS